jgi:formylglycine-generating enzyme required for sulfatase activity
MFHNERISRRSVLGTAAACVAAPLLRAAGNPLHGVDAIISGNALVRIPAGEFMMGAQGGSADEAPAHRVRISKAFEIGRFEVTQSQWETVMTNPHGDPAQPVTTKDGLVIAAQPSRTKDPSLPVSGVSWEDIQVFLTRLNQRDPKRTYRLPTEAEWEYACRTGGETGQLTARAWLKGNSNDAPHPVGSKQPDKLGLCDMQGNVAEWVADWYSPRYYTDSPAVDPKGPATTPDTGGYRVFRGSCWFHEAADARPSIRHFDFPVSRMDHVGFRIVRSI